jgi:hypothetical protein
MAGASAAIEAAGRGLSVTLVDEHPIDLATMALDTPYFFGPRLLPTLGDRGLMLDRIAGSSEWISRADEAGVKVLLGTCAWGSFRPGENSRQLDAGCLGLADGERSWMLECERLILAPGARDLVLSFPGWELPGVLGASAAAALLDPGAVPLASYRPPVRPLSMRVLGAQDEAEAVREEWASWFYPRLRIHS